MPLAQPQLAKRSVDPKPWCQIATPNSGEDVIVKLQPFPARGVLAQRNFIQCSTLIIVQNVLWQFSASRTVIIVNTEQ